MNIQEEDGSAEEREEQRPSSNEGQVDPNYRMLQKVYGSGKSTFTLEKKVGNVWHKLIQRVDDGGYNDGVFWAIQKPMPNTLCYYKKVEYASVEEVYAYIRSTKKADRLREAERKAFLASVIKTNILPVVL